MPSDTARINFLSGLISDFRRFEYEIKLSYSGKCYKIEIKNPNNVSLNLSTRAIRRIGINQSVQRLFCLSRRTLRLL